MNTNYLDPLQPAYPDNRLGPHGDAPKAYCSTCHQGRSKPLGGANLVNDYKAALIGELMHRETGRPPGRVAALFSPDCNASAFAMMRWPALQVSALETLYSDTVLSGLDVGIRQ